MKLLFGREQRYEIAYSVYLHQLFVATTTAHNHKMQKENKNNSKRNEKKYMMRRKRKTAAAPIAATANRTQQKKILIKLPANNKRRTEFHAKEKPIQRQTTQYDIFVSSITYRLVELIATRMLKISKR